MADKRIPDPVTDQERWIAKHRVDSIRVEYRQTSTDTAETFLHIGAGAEKVVWKAATFNAVANLVLSWATIAEPKPGIIERVKARDAWEKDNDAELAEYKRLKAKFEKGVGE